MNPRHFTLMKFPVETEPKFESAFVGVAPTKGRPEIWMEICIGDEVYLADLEELGRCVDWCRHRHEVLKKSKKR